MGTKNGFREPLESRIDVIHASPNLWLLTVEAEIGRLLLFEWHRVRLTL